MSGVAVLGAPRWLRATVACAALTLAASAAWAHPGHPVGEQMLAEPLHELLGVHWAVAEPVLMLAAVVVLSRIAGWAVSRIATRAGSLRRASRAG